MPRKALAVVVLALSLWGCEGPMPPETVGLIVVDKAGLSATDLVWVEETGAHLPVIEELTEERLLLFGDDPDEPLAWFPIAHVELGSAEGGDAASEEAPDEECSPACRCALSSLAWSARDSLLVAWREGSAPGQLRVAPEGAVLPRKSARFCATTKSRELAARFVY